MYLRAPYNVYLDHSGDGSPQPSFPFGELLRGETFTVVMDSRVKRQSPAYKVAYSRINAGGQNHKNKSGSVFKVKSDVIEQANIRKRMMPHEVIVVTRIK